MTEKPIAIVTGVGPGTGAAIVKRFAAGGFRIIALARSAELINSLAQELPDAQGRNRLDRKTSERSDQGEGRTTVTKTPAAKDPTRNVWLQLGLPDAEEHFLKAELVLRLDKAITSLA